MMPPVKRCTLLMTTLAVVLTCSYSLQSSKATRSLLFQSSPSMKHVSFKRATPEGTNLAPSNEPISSKTLLQSLDNAGKNLKPKAVKARAKASMVDQKSKKVLYLLETCGLYSLFILYRSYRGFFVILPAVFREVYSKMSKVVDTPFETAVAQNSSGAQDVDPETGKIRWRTRITVSFLAAVVTASYVISGAVRVLVMFFRTITQTSSVTGSFAAAADEQESNEGKILRLTNKSSSSNAGGINGEQLPPPSGELAP